MAISGRPTLAFADESKHADYILAVYEITEADYGQTRVVIMNAARGIDRVPVHCHSLRSSERLKFIELLSPYLANSVTLYVSSARYRDVARRDCLNQAVADLTAGPARSLTLERDRTIERSDRAIIHQVLERDRRFGTLQYGHASPAHEPCLWIPDVVAWHWQRGGRERALIRPLVREVIRV